MAQAPAATGEHCIPARAAALPYWGSAQWDSVRLSRQLLPGVACPIIAVDLRPVRLAPARSGAGCVSALRCHVGWSRTSLLSAVVLCDCGPRRNASSSCLATVSASSSRLTTTWRSSATCHLFVEAQNRALLGRAVEALRLDGTLAVIDVIVKNGSRPAGCRAVLTQLEGFSSAEPHDRAPPLLNR